MTRRVSELIRVCPECGAHTAVSLGESQGFSIYTCVTCDAEFTVEDP